MKTIGLCMIVKNEAQVILRALESVLELRDAFPGVFDVAVLGEEPLDVGQGDHHFIGVARSPPEPRSGRAWYTPVPSGLARSRLLRSLPAASRIG